MTSPAPSAFYVNGSNLTETLTNAMVARVTYSYARGDALAPLLQKCAVEALNDLQVPRGWVDSHKLADAIYNERVLQRKYRTKMNVNTTTVITPSGQFQTLPTGVFTTLTCDRDQTRNYVQHCLREMFHGCRYNHQHCYQIHLDAQCSPQCRQHRTNLVAKLKKAMQRPLCPTCFVMLPMTGICDTCEETS